MVMMMIVVMVSGEGRSGESNGTNQCDEEFLVHVIPAFRFSSFEVFCLSLTLSKGNQAWIPDEQFFVLWTFPLVGTVESADPYRHEGSLSGREAHSNVFSMEGSENAKYGTSANHRTSSDEGVTKFDIHCLLR